MNHNAARIGGMLRCAATTRAADLDATNVYAFFFCSSPIEGADVLSWLASLKCV